VTVTNRRSFLVFCAIIAAPPAAALAQTADPAIATIDGLDSALLESMKAGKAGAEARYTRLLPAVERAFDIPTMTRFAVGDAWNGYTLAEQSALTRAFGRLTAANLAHNFSGYDGEQFKVNPAVQTRGPDKLIRSQIVPKSGDPTELNYRMRQAGGAWKVIDVYFGSISQLTAQRSDFAAAAVPGGATNLLRKISAKADDLLKN
jgi:phospholipid transport system substrate-binding protein